jgi:hypothetical protein
MSIRIFVSHASKDRDLVKFFVHALEASFAIADGQIRCTSLPGYRLRSGAHTSSVLRNELAETDVIIGILTPESLESGWVMFELGAGWGAKKWVVPVLAGVDYDLLPGPLKESNTTDAATRAEIEQLFHEIGSSLNLSQRPAGRATEIIDELVEEAESYYEDEEDEEDDEDGDDEDKE